MKPPHASPTEPPLERGALATLAEQLAALYAGRIRAGVLGSGVRLPSVREAARRHALAPSTVVAAYDLLQAQGLVEARQQRGFFVRGALPAAAGASQADARSRSAPPHDVATLMRGMFEHQGGKALSPGIGTLPPDWLDLPLLHGAMRRALADDVREPASLRYGEPAGDARLRAALSLRLAGLGITAGPQQIVTTAGATQALDIVSRLLLAPGDTVLVDEPGWPVEFARLAQMGVNLAPVPRGAAGPDLAVMRRHLESSARPRVYITVSVLHNPTGATLPLATAHELLKLAEAFGMTIVEDDTYAWLAPPQAPRLAALDQLQRTIYLSGFSKILTPSWRVGFVAASPAMVERIIDRKLLTALTSPVLPERALAITLEQGSLRRHAERVVTRLAAARQRCVRLAQEAGFSFAAPPQGLFGWVETGVDVDRLTTQLHGQGWLLAPGSLFHATPRPSTLMRINFATAQEARLWRALREACDLQRTTIDRGAASRGRGAYHQRRTNGNEAASPELS
ncbi:MAG: PLP-dependent aminotransferase family protein [Pseudomonadota bacterium]